jgi:hypothetical protein
VTTYDYEYVLRKVSFLLTRRSETVSLVGERFPGLAEHGCQAATVVHLRPGSNARAVPTSQAVTSWLCAFFDERETLSFLQVEAQQAAKEKKKTIMSVKHSP